MDELELENEDEEAEAQAAAAKAEAEAKLREQLGSVAENVQGLKALAALAGDPQIRAILEARQAGKRVELVVGDEAPKPEDPPPNLEELSQTELAKWTVSEAEKRAQAMVAEVVKTLESKLGAVDSFVQTAQRKEMDQEVAAARKSFSDFDDYRDDMVQLLEANPTLAPQELYVLAKMRRTGSLPTAARQTETERPSMTSARSRTRRPEKQESRVAAFKQIVSRAAARAVEGLEE